MTHTVTALCLTADRQEQTDRVARCFLRQTYDDSRLLIYDSGKKPYEHARIASNRISVVRDTKSAGLVGRLRNEANALVASEIIAHFDSDDISTPNRIADQVEHLRASGAWMVIYDDVLFWREAEQEAWIHSESVPSVGSALCYWRRTWKGTPFPVAQGERGEEYYWIRSFITGAKIQGLSQISATRAERPPLICTIHPGNVKHYPRTDMERSTSWRRVPEYDALVRGIVEEA